MNCPSCGHPLENDARFCGECGTLIAPLTPAVASDAPVQPPSPPKKNKRIGVVRNLIACLLAWIAALLVFAASSLLCLQSMFSPNAIRTYAETYLVDELVDQNVLDFSKYNIGDGTLREIYKIDDIQQLLCDTAVDAYENVVLGKSNRLLTADKIETVLTDNLDEINEIAGTELTEKDIDKIVDSYEKTGEGKLKGALEKMTENELFSEISGILKTALSPITVIILLAVVVLLFVIILLIRRLHISSLIFGGVITLFGCISPLLASLADSFFISLLNRMDLYFDSVRVFLQSASDRCFIIFIIFAVISAVLIIVGTVLSILKKALKKSR